MAGTALAFTVGGMLNDNVHPTAPFFVTLALLFLFTVQTYLVLPYVAPKYTEGDAFKQDGEKKKNNKQQRGKRQSARKSIEEQIRGFFKPLKVFKTRRLEDWDGEKYHGVTLLAIGTFVSVLATAYVVSRRSTAWRTERGGSLTLGDDTASHVATFQYQCLWLPPNPGKSIRPPRIDGADSSL